MHNIERPGIDPKWAGIWKVVCRDFVNFEPNDEKENRDTLESFIQTGDIPVAPEFRNPPSAATPPFAAWESSYLLGALGMWARLASAWFEINSIQRGEWDVASAQHAFAAQYTGQTAQLAKQARYPKRFGREYTSLEGDAILYTALGFVIGNKDHAERLARLHILAIRKKWFIGQSYYPVYFFIIRLLADFLDEPMPLAEGEMLSEPILNALFDMWRTPDPTAIADLCVGACDIHTRRCRGGGTLRTWFEFGRWKRTPIELLLLFKLRQQLGLSNPVIDHPLMDTVLGKLPDEVGFDPDPLLARVRERMMQEGYDEQALFEECINMGQRGSANKST